MKENAPPCSNTGARGITKASTITPDAIKPNTAPAQAPPAIPTDGIGLASFWRGPRDHSRAIQFTFRQYHGTPFLDIRQFDNVGGYMRPTSKGLTISVAQLGRFAAAAGAAYREAARRGLLTGRST